ncbi:sulfotransferase family protein [Fodinicola acaciae]|uniref:sulfotransferase family protein n=1 Tax=Fodinicola acaciae TaxID=2681555 RepID=UPI0013D3FA4A|nr:sulfotransferase family protein [Fodinicola acaciae]
MKVIGAGFPRTGTSTQQAVLNQLGFGPCYHMREVMENPGHAAGWVDAISGRPYDLAELLAGYQSTTDAPGCFFWRELLAANPDAKVLLSVRDADKWYQSMITTVLNPELFAKMGDIAKRDPEMADRRRLPETMFDKVFGASRDKDHLIEIYQRHNADVRAEVPADQLLVYEVKQGWGPLCEFLGVPVPDEPYPHLNDSASFVQTVSQFAEQAQK